MPRPTRSAMVALALVAATTSGHAQAPPASRAALVLEVEGPTTPALKPYRELHAGTTVTLTPSTRLVFLHYDTCRTFTVKGGTVALPAGQPPAISRASAQADVPAQCPKTIPGSGASAAVLFRSARPPRMTVSATPTFVVVGRRAEEFVRVRVVRQDQDVLTRPLVGPRFDWPADVAPLAPGVYQLSFLPAHDATPPLTVEVEATATKPAEPELTLITAD